MTVLDNDETFAIDEFYFSFFSRTREAFAKLQASLNANVDDTTTSLTNEFKTTRAETTKFKDSVKDTTTRIRAHSPLPDSSDAPSSRQSSESTRSRHDLTDEPELLAPTPEGKKRRSFRMSRAALRTFNLPSFGAKRSTSPSPLD